MATSVIKLTFKGDMDRWLRMSTQKLKVLFLEVGQRQLMAHLDQQHCCSDLFALNLDSDRRRAAQCLIAPRR